ncbi:MAG: acetylornithine deacetylase [Actinomycetota bacterium]|nr:N-formyl-4-amino-5-aminomethyl-2-methylpyrimidine deformylase [Glaciihabitans sp.]MDQ1544646.1 acetylornithine deacetylase [Actinomycetota bacterium]
MQDLDAAITELFPRALDVLKRLVSNESTLGNEHGAQEVLAVELEKLAFGVTRFEIPETIGNDPAAGVPRQSYAGRYDIVGQRGTADGPTLVINGHMDVVPADDESRWTHPPFGPVVVDGWLFGRGAGDMKAGFAAGLLALWALDRVMPGWQAGNLTFVAAIEEESTGNGTLAAGRAGYTGDAALLLEPTDLEILLGGISLIWVAIEIDGLAGHAEAALNSVNPILGAVPIIEALTRMQSEMNAAHAGGDGADSAFVDVVHPYNVNVGKLHAGDWASSVPSVARLEVRVGHPANWSSDEAFARVKAAVANAVENDEWLRVHPPRLTLTGYRAERYMQDPDADLVTRLGDAHASVHGEQPARIAIGSTTDARFYLNQFGMPAVAYGPKTRNMHGTDESVELQSIIDCARTVARFLASWYARDPS